MGTTTSQAQIPPVIEGSGFEGPYKRVCAERPQNYSYYAKYDIEWGDLSQYEIV